MIEKMKRTISDLIAESAIVVIRSRGEEETLRLAATLAIPILVRGGRRAIKLAAVFGATAHSSIPPDLDRLWVAVPPLTKNSAAEFARSYDEEFLRTLPDPIRVISWWEFVSEYRERPEFLEIIERVIWAPVECRPGAICWHSDFGEKTILPAEPAA